MSAIPPVHGPEAGPTPSFQGRSLTVTRGSPLPLGASRTPSGINFVVVSRHATAVRLVLSDPRDPRMEAEIPLDPAQHRTGDHWHVRVDGLPEEFCYGYRVDGPGRRRAPVRPERRPARPGLPRPLQRPAVGRPGAARPGAAC